MTMGGRGGKGEELGSKKKSAGEGRKRGKPLIPLFRSSDEKKKRKGRGEAANLERRPWSEKRKKRKVSKSSFFFLPRVKKEGKKKQTTLGKYSVKTGKEDAERVSPIFLTIPQGEGRKKNPGKENLFVDGRKKSQSNYSLRNRPKKERELKQSV